jgi:three-Cys-motif partner protein
MSEVRLDEIGDWSEKKLDIVDKYIEAYSTIMKKQSFIKEFHYIDAFAGAGLHISKSSGKIISGSPLNALNVKHPFDRYHFIDNDVAKTDFLKQKVGKNEKVRVYTGDCNKILPNEIFPLIKYEEYKRALCFLDPYGLHLNWEVMHAAGQSRTIEIFLNFPLMDINRNVLRNNPEKVDKIQIERMNAFWGDESWRNISYKTQQGLFDTYEEKTVHFSLIEAFRKRLNEVAGFAYVPKPIPMRNTKDGIIYYLFFASPSKTGEKIAKYIFTK